MDRYKMRLENEDGIEDIFHTNDKEARDYKIKGWFDRNEDCTIIVEVKVCEHEDREFFGIELDEYDDTLATATFKCNDCGEEITITYGAIE